MKDRYKKVRKQIIAYQQTGKNQIELSFFHDYFIKEGGTPVDPRTFQLLFLRGDFSEVVKHLDKKFGIIILIDVDGQELKLIE